MAMKLRLCLAAFFSHELHRYQRESRRKRLMIILPPAVVLKSLQQMVTFEGIAGLSA